MFGQIKRLAVENSMARRGGATMTCQVKRRRTLPGGNHVEG